MSMPRPPHSSRAGTPLENSPAHECLAHAEYELAMEFSPFLGERDLVAALYHLTHTWKNESGVPTRLELEGAAVRTAADAVILRVADEALRNVLLHSCAERVVVTLSYLADRLHLAVLDDGRGFDLAFTTSGRGLRDLGERIAAFSGSLSIQSVPGHGCLLEATVPTSPRAASATAPEREGHLRERH